MPVPSTMSLSWIWTRLFMPVIASDTCTRHQTWDPHVANILLASSGLRWSVNSFMWSAKTWPLFCFASFPLRAQETASLLCHNRNTFLLVLSANVLALHSSIAVIWRWMTKATRAVPANSGHVVTRPVSWERDQSASLGVWGLLWVGLMDRSNDAQQYGGH